jgi:molybdopterin molybdotransferase
MNTMQTTSLSAIANAFSADANALSVEQAQQIMRQFIAPIDAAENVGLHNALGRVLAQDIVSPINVPAHDNSAMDGYALRGGDLGSEATTLQIVGKVLAGASGKVAVGTGQCVRIMTGAPMPADCDTVVPQELTRDASDTSVTIPAGAVRAGDNRRLKGEDLQAGKPALARGRLLRPADLGLLASLGVADVPVQRRLRVAFFSSGDELRSLGELLEPGCVYDSNRYTLFGMLTRLGCELLDMGVVKDDPVALESALRSACEHADAVITSGGVSVGDADYTRRVMAQLGDVAFWKINMRPGRPMAFGKISSNGKSAYLFGLPGNPVATMVSFCFFVREALLQMMGAQHEPLPLMRAVSVDAIRKKAGRTEYQRGILTHDAQGRPQVRVTGSQGSGILRSMSEANCMIVLPHEQDNVVAGDEVGVVLFDGLM